MAHFDKKAHASCMQNINGVSLVSRLTGSLHVASNFLALIPVAQLTIQQYSGKLTDGGDTMELTGQFTHSFRCIEPVGGSTPLSELRESA